MSWPSGDETDGEKLVPGRDGRSLINRSVSHEPNPKKSKERKTSTRKGFINFVSKIKTKRRKKSSDPSNNEENSFAVESTAESSSETLVAASNTAASSSPQSCENLSPVSVPEVLTDSLSAGESVTWPISLGYESGFMSMEGNAQCISYYSLCFIQDLMLMVSMLNFQLSEEKKVSASNEAVEYFAKLAIFQDRNVAGEGAPQFSFERATASHHPRRV